MSSFHSFAETYLIPLQLALAMLGMGATLRPRDFGDILRDPRGLALGLVLQLVVVPALAVAFTKVFDLGPGWSVGLFLIAVVPGGAFSNLLTFLGRGNVPLSIAVTVSSTLLCVATVPLILGIIASSYLPSDFDFPTQRIAVEIGLYLLVPLIAGMAILRFVPRAAEAASKWSIRGSMTLIGVITVSALGSGRITVWAYGWQPPVIIVGFGLALAIVIPQLTRLLGRYDDDSLALGIEVIVRNVGVALLLVRFFFPDTPMNGHVLYSCLFYAGLSGFLAVPMLLSHRWGHTAVPFRRPKPRP